MSAAIPHDFNELGRIIMLESRFVSQQFLKGCILCSKYNPKQTYFRSGGVIY